MSFAASRKNRQSQGYKANFLWPCDEGSIQEAGYEFANAGTEAYRKTWWKILLNRVSNSKKATT